jgi:hypothetical protein
MRSCFKVTLYTFILLIQSYSLIAQPFSIDDTFQPTYVFRDYWDEDEAGSIIKVIELDDGTLRLSGGFQDPYDNYYIGNNIKLSSTGVFDPNYGTPSTENGYMINYHHPYILIYNFFGLVRTDYQTGVFDTVFLNNQDSSNWGGGGYGTYIFDNGDFLFGGSIHYQLGTPEAKWSRIARIFENGVYDTSFHHNADYDVSLFEKYDEDRIMIAGLFHTYDNVPMRAVARIYNDGSLDTTFHSIFDGMNCTMMNIYVQDDEKIIIGGAFYISGISERLGMVRLLPNGDLDTTFNNFNNAQSSIGLLQSYPNDESQYYITSMTKTPNNKLLMGGDFTHYQGFERHNIVLADSNGFIDTTVFTGSGIDTCLGLPTSGSYTKIYCIVPTQNNKYYVAGKFSGFNGQMTEPIIRLNPHDHVGIEEQEEKEELLIFPNPARETLMLHADNYVSNAEVFSIEGCLVKEVRIGGTQKRIDLSMLPPGNYFILATGRDKVWVEKFVVIR